MATTGRMMGLLATEERRKRSRTERDEDEEPRLVPELPIEMQLAIVEHAELGRRDAIPEPSDRLVEVSKIWYEVYAAWRAGRAAKMEHPPDLVSLDMARLFVSPRFKFITEMQGFIAQEILMVFANAMEAELPNAPRFPVLMFYRAAPVDLEDKWEWRIAFLTGIRKNEEGLIVFESLGTKFGGGIGEGAAIRFTDTKTVWAGNDSRPLIVDWDWTEDDDDANGVYVSDVLIYGQTNYYPMISAPKVEVLERLKMAAYLFWIDAIRFDRPTRGMLAWRDKIVVVQAAARPGHLRAGQGGYHELSSDTKTVQVDVIFYDNSGIEINKITTRMFGGTTIRLVSEYASKDAMAKLHASVRPSHAALVLARTSRVREEIVWPNGVRLELSEWKMGRDGKLEGEKAFAFPPLDRALDAIQARVAEMPEPALKSFTDHPDRWGYEMSTWIPLKSGGMLDDSDVKGVLIMPAPWFFYLATERAEDGTEFLEDSEVEFNDHFGLAETGFWFRPHTAMLLTNGIGHIYAHQTHDLIFLPDAIDNVFVEDLTMMQRRDIKERATAPLVEEVAEGIELL